MRYFILLIIIHLSIFTSAQIVSGYISDKVTGEKLIGASVYEKGNYNGTSSNAFGYYSLPIKSINNYILIVKFIGYKTEELEIQHNNSTLINIELTPISYEIDRIKVTDKIKIEERSEMSIIKIPMQQIKQLPMIAGEVDLIKALQLMPGVKQGSEAQSIMSVRGGSNDQNLLLLDDIPLYNINHLGGYVSIFNTEAIQTSKLYKGAFPARYGSRLSSVMDIRMKDGSMRDKRTVATIGMLSSKLHTEGYIKKDTASYMISGRRFMYDLITKPIAWIVNKDHSNTGYTFYDINAKFNYKFSDKDRLLFSFYMGNDKFSSSSKEKHKHEKNVMKNKVKWGNTLISLRWNRIVSKRVFTNITAYYTQYRYKSNFKFIAKTNDEEQKNKYSFLSNINDLCIKSDFYFNISKNYNLYVGTNSTHHSFRPHTTLIEQNGFGDNNINHQINNKKLYSWENSIYLENKISLSKFFSSNIGARATAYSSKNKTYYNIEPRLLFNITIPKVIGIKGSYSKMQQYLHSLSYSNIGLSSNLWLPVTKNTPPQYADIYSLAIVKSLFKSNIELSVEAYYKTMNNLIDYKEGVGTMGSNIDNWEDMIERNGKGTSKGLECLIYKQSGKITGWIAYTLSQTNRQFDNINNGNTYPYIYDVTHDFAITGSYYIKKNMYFSANWVYMSGKVIDFANEVYSAPHFDNKTINNITSESNIEDMSYGINKIPNLTTVGIGTSYNKNGIRTSPYHRLDISFTYTKQKKNSTRIWNFSIYNVYNKQNPSYYFYDSKEITDSNNQPTGQYKTILKQRSIFMFLPSVSYTISW